MTRPASPTDDVRMKGFRAHTDVEAVHRLLAGALRPQAPEPVPVTECAGRVLAADVTAPIDLPGFDRAAMDGYAVIAAEVFGATPSDPLPLRLAGEAFPGRPFDGRLSPGSCVRIMTGAPTPEGADAVVPAETARAEGDTVLILEPLPPGKHISRRGEDVTAGSHVLDTGRLLRPQDAALLASLGLSPVKVIRRPRVAILTTGDELLPPGETPRESRIVDSNSVMLETLVRRDGGLPVEMRRLEDSADLLRAALRSVTADVILIAGGSSVGLEDHAPSVVAELGQLPVHGVAMRPASPTGVGFLPCAPPRAGIDPAGAERPVFLLPGNPVSCLCAYDFFAGPSIRKLGGRPTEWPYAPRILPVGRKIVSQVGRVDYMRVRIVKGKVEPLAIGGAGILSSTVRADGFVIIDRDAEGHAPGEEVTVHLYDTERGAYHEKI